MCCAILPEIADIARVAGAASVIVYIIAAPSNAI